MSDLLDETVGSAELSERYLIRLFADSETAVVEASVRVRGRAEEGFEVELPLGAEIPATVADLVLSRKAEVNAEAAEGILEAALAEATPAAAVVFSLA